MGPKAREGSNDNSKDNHGKKEPFQKKDVKEPAPRKPAVNVEEEDIREVLVTTNELAILERHKSTLSHQNYSDRLLNNIGKAIRNFRLIRNLSQADLADLLVQKGEFTEAHQTQISRIEGKNSNFSFRRLVKIAECLKISVSHLVGEAERISVLERQLERLVDEQE